MAEPLEDFMREAVTLVMAGPAFDRARQAVAVDSRAGAELAAAERRLEQLADAYAEGQIGLEAYERGTAKLQARLAELRREAAAEASGVVARKLPAGDTALRAWWDRASVEEQAEVVGLVVESIMIGPGVRGFNRFDPRPVQILWRV
jgi:hypothetical protein